MYNIIKTITFFNAMAQSFATTIPTFTTITFSRHTAEPKYCNFAGDEC